MLQFGEARLPQLAQTPTVEEAGFGKLDAVAWWGVFAPHGTPADIVARMYTALRDTFNEPRIHEQMVNTQQARLDLADGNVLRVFLDRQIETWSKVVRENNVKAD